MSRSHHMITVDIEGRRFPRGVRLLRVVDMCGVRVPVVAANLEQWPALLEADGTTLDGTFDYSLCAVIIRAGQSHTLLRDAVTHELVHAFLHLSGIGRQLKALMGKRAGERWEEIEEGLVRTATPHLATLLIEGKSWL
jgi:hypothetical protein